MEYPPKNRMPKPLDILDVRVVSGEDDHRYDPNRITVAAITENLPSTPFDGAVSVLSGKPAVIYMADDLCIPLTTSELRSLVLTGLTPGQYFKLRDLYGMAHEWHDDFYDEETGEAWQDRTN